MVVFFEFMNDETHYKYNVKKQMFELTDKATQKDKISYKEYLKMLNKE